VGRLTQALAPHFDECLGVDISEEMLAEARRLAESVPGVRFVLNDRDELRQFGDGSFDLVYSHIVLQHVPDRAAVLSYIAEFVRVLAPGGLVSFQLPSRIARRHRLQPHRRAWSALRRLGVGPEALYRLRLQPIHMGSAPVAEVTGVLRAAGGHVLAVDTSASPSGNESSIYYVTR
jgi:SAM-dependent methyltransferase